MDSKIVIAFLNSAFEDYIDARLLIKQDRLFNGGHLSSLASEKLLKSLILATDIQPKYLHLDKADKLINQVSKSIPNIQNFVNTDFLHYLGEIFSMRYYPERSDDRISISRNKLLWELDRLFDQVHSFFKFESGDNLASYSKEKNANNPLIYDENQWLLGKHDITELEALPDFIVGIYRFSMGAWISIQKELPKTFVNCKLGEEVKISAGNKQETTR